MAIEPASVDWSSARRASYLVRQTFRYEYPEPIRDLSHRLVVIPPERFGDQRRLWHDVSVALDGARVENRSDRFGNVIVEIFAPRVADAIEFVAEVSVTSWWRASERGRTWTVATVGALTLYLNSQPTRRLTVFSACGMAETL